MAKQDHPSRWHRATTRRRARRLARRRLRMACKTVAAEPFAVWQADACVPPMLHTHARHAQHARFWTVTGPEESTKKLHCSYRRLKEAAAYGRKPNRSCGRRTWVMHIPGVSSTLIHIHSTPDAPRQWGWRSSAQKGRPAEAGLPHKNLGSRISAQLHRRNGKSIQCPFNVTTYLGHTLFVGSALQLFLYFVIMLSIPAIANRNGTMFRIFPNCWLSIVRIMEMRHTVRIALRVCAFPFV